MPSSALLLAQSANSTAPDTMGLVFELLFTTVAVFALAGVMYWAMRVMAKDRDGKGDADHVRTVAAFEVPGATDDAQRLAALAAALVEPLGALGVKPSDPLPVGDALCVPLEVRETVYVLKLERAPGQFVATLLDRGPATRSLAEAHLAPLAGPTLQPVLDAVHRSLNRVPGLDGLRWHKREAWEHGQRDAGTHTPIA